MLPVLIKWVEIKFSQTRQGLVVFVADYPSIDIRPRDLKICLDIAGFLRLTVEPP